MPLKLLLDNADTINVALNRPASQSSHSQWSQPEESRRAVNGHRSGSFTFHTGIEANPWWRVDLEGLYPIDAIVVWNRDDEFADRAADLRLQVSLDGIEWLTVYSGRTYFRGTRSSRPFVHLLEGKVYARFVKIDLCGPIPTPLHLDQVEVLAAKDRLAAEEVWERAQSRSGERVVNFDLLAKRADYEVHRGAGSAGGKIEALKVRRYGRFGNNFHQLLNACVLAKELDISDIILDDQNLASPPAQALGGLRILPKNTADFGLALYGTYYNVTPFAALLSRVAIDRLYDTLTRTVQPLYDPLLDQAKPTPGAMHFHFRSGDIFREDILSAAYAQPPLAFYKAALTHAIAHFAVTSAVVVYEDKVNPCVDAFIDHLWSIGLPFSTQSSSLEEDIVELLGARILCHGFGTFAEAILCLSRHAEAAYAFRTVDSFPHENKPPGLGVRELLLKKGLKLHLVADAAGAYTQKDRWANSAEQRRLMLEYRLDDDPVIAI